MSYFIKGTATIPLERFWRWVHFISGEDFSHNENRSFLPQVFLDSKVLSVISNDNALFTIDADNFWRFSMTFTPCKYEERFKCGQIKNTPNGITFDFIEAFGQCHQEDYLKASTCIIDTWNTATSVEHCITPDAWAVCTLSERKDVSQYVESLLADGQQPRLHLRGPDLFRAHYFADGNFWEDNHDPAEAFRKAIDCFNKKHRFV
jgi:hypothetical protein